jgi:hypothetical protein
MVLSSVVFWGIVWRELEIVLLVLGKYYGRK